MLVQFQLFARGIINRKCFFKHWHLCGDWSVILYLTPSCNVRSVTGSVLFFLRIIIWHYIVAWLLLYFTSLLFYVIPCFQEWLKKINNFYKARADCVK